jgi:DNA-binding winged-HTH domains
MERLRHTSVLRFGTYELNPHSGELRKAGVRIKVQQQPLKLLEILLEHPGKVVTREELRACIWPDESFGDFDQAVNVAVAKLRGALSDSADNPRYIETIPRRGYRFIAEVAVLARDSEKPESALETSAMQVAVIRSSPLVNMQYLGGCREGFLGRSLVFLYFCWPSAWSRSSAGGTIHLRMLLPRMLLSLSPFGRWPCFRWKISPAMRRIILLTA